MIRARFIGVGRFADPNISELTGCVRDATALCALFQDSVPGADAAALVDAQATLENVTQALTDTLHNADSEDAVVLSFATHGTRDHRIVVHDTSLSDLGGTTVSMAQLSQAFRECRARFILCILDCCFGGAAPARVILDTPQSRDLIDFASFEGVGRLLLAASRLDEPAYEHPARRHGLLTAALIDALTSGEHPGVLSLVEHVVNRVRADAAAMGVGQNPVATTYIDGGFTLPVFVRGDRFHAAFPEYAGTRVATISDIAAFDIPEPVIAEWAIRYNNHLHPIQLDAINEHRVLDGASLFAIAPTSSGKTFIGELAAVRAIVSGRKAVFLLPYKALVNEKYDDFSAFYGQRLDMRVIRCTGDHHDRVREFVTGRFDIALLTYEMFLGIAVTNAPLLNLIGLIVLDEAQLITDRSRGINVELLLTFLRSARQRQVAPQLVLLSATVGALNHFDDWLDITVLRSDARPVPLEVGVLDRSGAYEYLDQNGAHATRQLLTQRVYQRRDAPSSQDVIVPLVRQLLSDQNASETMIVFRNTRGSAEGCANYLAAELGLPAAQQALADLPSGDLSASSPRLRTALAGGTACHTSNLSREERVVVERAFRSREGFRTYVTSPADPISSSFAAGELATWVVRLLRQVEHIPRADVPTMLLNTYGGYLQSRRDVGFLDRVRAEVPALLARMEANGLIAEDGRGIFLTALGRACGQSTLSFESCLRLIEALRAVGNQIQSPEVILAVTESLPESDETYVPLQRRGTAEQRWPAAVRERFGPTVAALITRRAEPLVALARCKRTLIALAWADGVPLERIESNFSVNPFNAVAAGDIRSIAESVRFRMRTRSSRCLPTRYSRVSLKSSVPAWSGCGQRRSTFTLPPTSRCRLLPCCLKRCCCPRWATGRIQATRCLSCSTHSPLR
ncbi:MAG: DEAD/DEAH box helicase [Luteitalea sp.]|nr:DEAD/DEAH box helicase [Luteitalea sp.]